MKPLKLFEKNKNVNEIAMKGGSYSLISTALVLAILIAANVFVSMLPSSLTKFDISAVKLYSITANTKVVVNNLKEDVDIYWIVQADQEDSVIENLLSKYETLSDHINIEKKNPDIYPTFASQYTSDDVANNSLVVVSGNKYRYIAYDEIYLTDIDYTTYSYVYSFDGEGAITSAIDYVVNDDLPLIYILQGHGEIEISDEFADKLSKSNYETAELSLLTVESIPEDCDGIIINGPTSDISDIEADMLIDYVENGGKLLVMSGISTESTLDNLARVIAYYGAIFHEGVLLDVDSDHYAFQSPYILLPDINSSTVTDSLISGNYNVIVPIASPLSIDNENNCTITELLTTSSASYNKVAGYYMQTYDFEDGDEYGPFDVAIEIDNNNNGSIIWINSSYFVDETSNAYSSGANLNFVMNALTYLTGENKTIAISAKSLGYNYLTISDSTAVALETVMIAVLPLSIIVYGIYVIVGRKRRTNE